MDGTDQTQSLNVSGSPSNVTFSYLITGLDSGSRYQIQVAAVNGAGDGTFGRVLASTNYTGEYCDYAHMCAYAHHIFAVQCM